MDNNMSEAEKNIKTLNILIDHWIEHNDAHRESFNEWAEKAEKIGKNETAEYIRKAAECFIEANEALKTAKSKI